MRRLIEQLPYPAAGLLLAYATLGNLMEVFFGLQVKYLCGSLAFLILVLLLAKMILFPASVMNAMGMMPVAGVMATLPMGLMLLSVYVKPINGVLAVAIWIIGLALNVLIMVFFTIRHALPFKTDKLLANYYVTYIGIVVASVTAKAYGFEGIGVVAFAFGLLSYLVLLPAISYRYAKKAPVPAPLRPLIAIYAAPANLLVVGYLSLNLTWSELLLYALWGVGVTTTLFAWQQIYKLRKSDFYPGFSAFTFPLVIGAVSTVKFNAHLVATEVLLPVVKYFGLLQTMLACLAVVYVTCRYIRFLSGVPAK